MKIITSQGGQEVESGSCLQRVLNTYKFLNFVKQIWENSKNWQSRGLRTSVY
jgi:hypothetical protein